MSDLDADTRLKLIGLKAIANDLNKQMEAVKHVVMSLTGDDDETGWCSDFLFDEKITVARLWKATASAREAAK